MNNMPSPIESCPICGSNDTIRPKLVMIDEEWVQEPSKDSRERYLVDLRVDDIALDEVRKPPLEQYVDGLYCEKCARAFIPDSMLRGSQGQYHGADGRKRFVPRLTPIITEKKLQIYEKFNGDIDGFSRGATQGERDSITAQDWRMIEEMLQSLCIVQSGLANADFEARVRQIVFAVQDENARAYLLRLSKLKT